MKTATIIKLVDGIIDLLFYFLREADKAEKEKNREEIKDDPVDWFNDRYHDGVQSDEKSDKSTGSEDDPKT